jgi:hypothetical protein
MTTPKKKLRDMTLSELLPKAIVDCIESVQKAEASSPEPKHTRECLINSTYYSCTCGAMPPRSFKIAGETVAPSSAEESLKQEIKKLQDHNKKRDVEQLLKDYAPSSAEPLSADEWLKRSDVVRPQYSRQTFKATGEILPHSPKGVYQGITMPTYEEVVAENEQLRAAMESAKKLLLDCESVHKQRSIDYMTPKLRYEAIETLSSALESKTEK